MPLIRRCPRCGDDLSPDEAVCVFCGHRVGRATLWERVRLGWEDKLYPLALLAVTYLVGLDLLLWLVGFVVPEVSDRVHGSPGLARALRIALTLAVLAVLAIRAAVAARRGRRPPPG